MPESDFVGLGLQPFVIVRCGSSNRPRFARQRPRSRRSFARPVLIRRPCRSRRLPCPMPFAPRENGRDKKETAVFRTELHAFAKMAATPAIPGKPHCARLPSGPSGTSSRARAKSAAAFSGRPSSAWKRPRIEPGIRSIGDECQGACEVGIRLALAAQLRQRRKNGKPSQPRNPDRSRSSA